MSDINQDKLWEFEKNGLATYMVNRPEPDILKHLEEKEIELIDKDLKYGTLEYISDGIMFKPSKDDANSVELNFFLGDQPPNVILKQISKLVRPPYLISVDFWCIAQSTEGLLVVYPSYGTCINKKNRLMKTHLDVEHFLNKLDHEKNDLRTDIFKAHASSRITVLNSGISITKILSMWIRLKKISY